VPIVLKSGSFNLLQPSRPVQACNGIALPLPYPSSSTTNHNSANPIPNHYCRFSNIFILTPIFTILLSEGRAGEAWEPSNNLMLLLSPFPPSCLSFCSFCCIFRYKGFLTSDETNIHRTCAASPNGAHHDIV